MRDSSGRSLSLLEKEVEKQTKRPHIDDNSPPEVLIPWSLQRFADQRVVMTTSFGMEGCALIDMYSKALKNSKEWEGRRMQVVYLDTGFFFTETYDLKDKMIERYPNMDFINRGTALTPEEQERQYGPELWKHDPNLCCRLRKVDPMFPVMAETDVWITGLRRSQSPTRRGIKTVEFDLKYSVTKVSPLADLERADILRYVRENEIPYNPLHEQGYPTIGCTHCTTPIKGSKVGEYSRAGRWSGTEMTECGLHGGAGI